MKQFFILFKSVPEQNSDRVLYLYTNGRDHHNNKFDALLYKGELHVKN